MIRVVAKFPLQAGQMETFQKLAGELIDETRKEKGCAEYTLSQSNSDENLVAILEAWESQDALNAHLQTEHFKRLVPKLAALCEGIRAPELSELYTQII